MDHALKVAAGQAPGAEQILSVAGRLARDAAEGWAPLPATRGPGGMAPPGGPDNLHTLRACQGVLSQTLQLLG